jgi:hypothetical protein
VNTEQGRGSFKQEPEWALQNEVSKFYANRAGDVGMLRHPPASSLCSNHCPHGLPPSIGSRQSVPANDGLAISNIRMLTRASSSAA